MTSSTNEIVPDGKRKKVGNRARPRPEKVRGSWVSKRHRTTHHQESLQEIQSLTETFAKMLKTNAPVRKS